MGLKVRFHESVSGGSVVGHPPELVTPKYRHKQGPRRLVMTQKLEREWMSIKELMLITGLGRTKCYNLVASGELEALKVGRSIRVSRASYEEWTRRHRYLDVMDEQGW
jgi:excisionase family DNA binding protein